MLNLSSLKAIGADEKSYFENFFHQLNSPSCELSFANLAMWQSAYQTKYCEYEGRLIFYSPAERMIYFPAGAFFPPSELAMIHRTFLNADLIDNYLYDIPESYVNLYAEELGKYFAVNFNEDNFDYLYENSHLVNLEGSKLRKKRNLIHQFQQIYPNHKIELINSANLETTFALAAKLNAEHEAADFLLDENTVLEFARANFEMLGLHGILLTVDETPVGFSIYSLLNQNYADIHFEKSRHDYKGAPQFLTWSLAKNLLEQVPFMNREQDLGNPGIRQAKHSLDFCALYRRAEARLI